LKLAMLITTRGFAVLALFTVTGKRQLAVKVLK
jgi:hypothetical protein